jgi:hypothetical protein
MKLVKPPAPISELRRNGDHAALIYRQYNDSAHGYTTPM